MQAASERSQKTKEILKKVRHIEIYTRRLVNDVMAGEYHSVFKGRGVEFDEVREYQPGDDIRTIDWNVTARTGRPYVKRYVEERDLTVMFCVDVSASGEFGTTDKTKQELAAEVCAVLAFSAIKNNDRVGLILFTDQVERYVPPKKGRTHALRVIRDLLNFQPTKHRTNIPGALDYLNRVLRRRAVVFLVSDFFGANLKKPLAIANRRHDLIALSVGDPREEAITPSGLMLFEDAETGEVVLVDTYDKRVRLGFEGASRSDHTQRELLFDSLAVDHVNLSTGRSYVKELRRLFEERARRQ
ncbi:MAG: DUF58 domain-containing protein [Candidatus Sumerlaeia bacterium]|nr:DUF58 domain-containing protein [Candidatus Sumerlaeia bacterium]